jgi:dUTP pyrophosphatase
MRIKPLHPNFKPPIKGSLAAGGYDIAMPEAGFATNAAVTSVGLGFAAEVPVGHVAVLLPRSGTGGKHGLELNNTAGIIDADYRGEWIAKIKTKNQAHFAWEAGERVLQFLIIPVKEVEFEIVDSLTETDRGEGGFGSSGKN